VRILRLRGSGESQQGIGVEQCDGSAKASFARIVLAPGAQVDVETLKAKVVESGFPPGEATVRSTSE